jgi:hypothetical protein
VTAHLLDELDGIVENGERGKTEEVHLQQAHLLDGHHVEGSYDFIVLRFMERDQFRQGTRRNHHACRVHARIADEPFELQSGIE